MRPSSRASRGSTTPRPESPTKHTRSASRASTERRLMGPRNPSPLPPKSPAPPQVELPSMDDDLALDAINRLSDPTLHAPLLSAIPRSRRQPFYPTGNTEATPKATNVVSSVPGATPIEPLSIKKKTSLRSSAVLSPTPRKNYVRNSPLSRSLNRVVSPRRVSPGFKKMKANGSTAASLGEDLEHLRYLSVSTKDDVRVFICRSTLNTDRYDSLDRDVTEVNQANKTGGRWIETSTIKFTRRIIFKAVVT